MPDRDAILQALITLSRRVGDPNLDCAILGEGNTSARASEETFWVKASGKELRTADAATFVEVDFERVLTILEMGDLSDEGIKSALLGAKTMPDDPLRPSVETIMHALALTLGGASFVAHTHPTSVNSILCSQKAEEAFAGRLFPDEIVICGVAPVYIPYTDPGVSLAREFKEGLLAYRETYGEPPKVVLIQNHGLVALGGTAQEAENVTTMMDKAARILLGTYALGGPHFLSQSQVNRLHTRPDEAYRRQLLR